MNIDWCKVDDWIRKVELTDCEAKIHQNSPPFTMKPLKEKDVFIDVSYAKPIIWKKKSTRKHEENIWGFLRAAQN